MAPKPSLSITLPRNFTFHYDDAEIPHTPAASPHEDVTEPPPPPKQVFKVRRRRAENQTLIPRSQDDELATLPTFEMTEAEEESSPRFQRAITPGYLAPSHNLLPLLSPPKTPVSQTGGHTLDHDGEWSMINNGAQAIPRPMSACSSFSDSSTSSFGSSINSRMSYGGSCTSPESDAADPFSSFEFRPKISQPIFSPDLPGNEDSHAKRAKTHRHTRWTPEMDNHLWLTYVVYIQDPRVTPFKMLPGTAPPLGVCHRVAREAKHSWKGHRAASLGLHDDNVVIPRISVHRSMSPEFAAPQASAGNSTPIATEPAKLPSSWPRSEAATRRRLRELCKRKPSLSAHYQRLLQTRSPSPLQSSSPRSRSDHDSSAFSSRSLNVSLAAATTPSMQADAPIAQLSSELPAQPSSERPDGWFARIGRSQAHQKSQSLQLGLGLGYGYSSGAQTFRPGVLASPFAGGMNREDLLKGLDATQSLGRSFTRRPDGQPSLNSPLELHAPIPTARSLKRRFRLDEDAQPSQNSLENLFSGPSADTTPRPSRDRAFSLGAVGDGTRSLSSFFSRQMNQDVPMPDISEVGSVGSMSSRLQAPEPTRRLGSPFGGATAPSSHFNTFPRRFTPLGSDNPNQTFEERFRELAAQGQGQNQ